MAGISWLPSGNEPHPGTPVFSPLAGATATGPGNFIDFGNARNIFGLQVVTTGTPSTFTVKLELSLDGVTWLAATNTFTNASTTIVSNTGPARYARANLTALTGGTNPTFTAFITAV